MQINLDDRIVAKINRLCAQSGIDATPDNFEFIARYLIRVAIYQFDDLNKVTVVDKIRRQSTGTIIQPSAPPAPPHELQQEATTCRIICTPKP